MSEFSDRFRMLKDESGATLKELSEKLDITVPNLSYYMKGREPSYDILIKIADYFNVTTDWLIGRTDEKTTAQSSIIADVEKQLNLKDSDRLSGKARELYLKQQGSLYNTMIDMYSFYLSTNSSYERDVKYFSPSVCDILNLHIKELNKGFENLSKDSILNLMKKEEFIADVLQTSVLFSSYAYADYLSHSENLPESDRNTVQEIVNFTFNNFKEKNPDKNTFETFLKMSFIMDD